ncbi:MAG TPA: dienelactone hydrolase family protein [Methylomirabilota bacterium]|jgi:carboxymethylenebutenolidase|nr:dienelactone hydrolase family protein [Methylomirabilota bacterium]
MGETITLTAEDGHKLAAYRVAPKGNPRGGLVVIQEIFGVNSHIKRVTDGFAADGYVALAPAIFDRVERDFAIGYKPEDIERGRGVRGKLPIEDAVKDVRAAVKALAAERLKVGVVGYCFGGTLAWLAATRIDGVACAVGYYGGGIADTAAEKPRCPVLLHWGETDQSIPPEHHARVRAAHPDLPMHVYPAGHGFNCDERASYHEPSAKLARQRTLESFAKHL